MALFLVLHLGDATKADMVDGRTCYARTVNAADAPSAVQAVAAALNRGGRYGVVAAGGFATAMGVEARGVSTTVEP